MSQSDFVGFLREKRLLVMAVRCQECGNDMRERRRNTGDGFAWVCYKGDCNRRKSGKSVRCNSFFEDTRLALLDCMIMIELWCAEYSIKAIVKDYRYVKSTVVRFTLKLRERVRAYYASNMMRLGDPGIICQLDESLIVHKVKNHTGRPASSNVWLFGIADCSVKPSKLWMEVGIWSFFCHQVSRKGPDPKFLENS